MCLYYKRIRDAYICVLARGYGIFLLHILRKPYGICSIYKQYTDTRLRCAFVRRIVMHHTRSTMTNALCDGSTECYGFGAVLLCIRTHIMLCSWRLSTVIVSTVIVIAHRRTQSRDSLQSKCYTDMR